MRSILEFIVERFTIRSYVSVYKRLITFNISEYKTRESLKKLLVDELGFEKQHDRSTYAQKKGNNKKLYEIQKSIETWVKTSGVNFGHDDFIDIYNIEEIGFVLYSYRESHGTLVPEKQSID